MSFMDFFSKFTGGFGGASSVDLAIDLGTANTLVAITGEGVVLNEPSVVAIERSTHRVLAVGHEAKQMINHTPDAFSAEHPLRDGVIADYDVTEAMLSAFINKAIERRYPWQAKPRIVICIPCGATSVEKRAVFEAAIQSGARQAYLIEEPMAAAMGADLPVTEPTGSMVVDIGGGTTDVAVISLGGIVESTSIKVAGDKFDEAIVKYVRRKHNALIGDRTAEEIKRTVGCVYPRSEEAIMEVRGRCLMTGLPRTFTVSSSEILDALEEVSSAIVEAVHWVLERTPPELTGDISANGITMTGGGSLIWGFDKLIASKTGIPTRVADEAVSCVAYGTGNCLENLSKMQDGTMNLSRQRQMKAR